MKPNLLPYKFADATSLGATFTTAVIPILYMDNIALQLNCTNANAVGTFAVEVSLDYVPASLQGPAAATGNWVALSLPSTPTLASATQVISLNLNQIAAPYMRVVYTRTSGTGTMDGFVCGKMI